MSSRDDLTALSTRRPSLEQAQEHRELGSASARYRASLPVLDNLRIAAPCTADWEQMRGDDRARFCGECKQHVYNLTNMTREEARALLLEREGRICVRYFQRHDGTILLGDCEVGVRRRRGRRLLAATAALAVATAAVTVWQVTRSGSTSAPPQPVGAPERPRPPNVATATGPAPSFDVGGRVGGEDHSTSRDRARQRLEETARTRKEALERAIQRKEGRFVGGGIPRHNPWGVEPVPSRPAGFVVTH